MLSTRSRAAAIAAMLGAATLAGCGGGRHEADAFWAGGTVDPAHPETEEKDGADPQNKPKRQIGAPDDFSGAPTVAPQEQTATWVGVRHDLALAPSSARKDRCGCLAVEVGDAKDPKFQWAAGAPDIGGDAIAIALTARGVQCPGGPAEDKRRPSISAVDQVNNDVVVEVEELPAGRPLASGAVIPRPAPGGAIYVKARSAKLPYAKAGGGRCKVY